MFRTKMARLITVIVIACLIYSCGFQSDSDNVTLGDNFITSQATLSVIDTFAVRLSTVMLDSVATSGNNIIWTGRYTDDELGKLTAESYFRIGIPATTDVKEKDSYDSLKLVIHFSAGYYGDTTKQQQIKEFPLNKVLKGDDGGYLYNKSVTDIKGESIGDLTFLPKPKKKGILNFRLSDNLGLDLFQKLIDQDEIIKTDEKFVEYFKGIALVPGTGNTAVLGFKGDTTAQIVLYSHRIGLERQSIRTIFPLTESTLQYNRFVTDRTGTWIEKIKKKSEEIPSSESGQRSFVQSGTGLLTRVDFPSMQRLIEVSRHYLLLKAELILVPEPGSYSKMELPTQIVLYHTDKSNRMVSEIVGSDNSTLPAEYQIDKIYHEDTWYKFDITDFISTEMADAYFDTDHGLLIGESSSKLGSSLNRVVFSDRKNSLYKPVVKLYFLFYNL
jgi:hypothetical protein